MSSSEPNSHHIFMLPDLEAYVHGANFKSKLRKWNKSQGFKEMKNESLKEWCLDTIVLDTLLKINNYKFSPLGSPISPLTPEPKFEKTILDRLDNPWIVPPCRGNLLDDYKASTGYKSDLSISHPPHNKRHGFKKIWRKMRRHQSYDSLKYEQFSPSCDLMNRFAHSTSRTDSDSDTKYLERCQIGPGSTNVLKLPKITYSA